ncbi:interleukin-6-like [Protopterus annectens]|uniref:interleukin-6-like n=1 Tax=Protopterus annectens TaxID=7888 RepID=UPI001CFAE259|nr:interleukin-6-like [Protopterus annectens]
MVSDRVSSFSALVSWVALHACLITFLSSSPVASSPLPEVWKGDSHWNSAPGFSLLFPDWISLAQLIHDKSDYLRTQLCDKDAVCDNSMGILLQNNLTLPRITVEDGCYGSNFNKEKCLQKIATGLYLFRPYLLFVQDTLVTEEKEAKKLVQTTKHLADAVNLVIKHITETQTVTAEIPKTILEALPSEKVWIQKVTSRFILQNFIIFMEQTIRALRHAQDN